MNHPITDQPFDYGHVCGTCAHFTERQRSVRGTKYKVVSCALNPKPGENLAETRSDTSWKSVPACTQHRPAS